MNSGLPFSVFLSSWTLLITSRMVSLAVFALGSRSWAHSALFSGVITGTLNATLLQVAIFGSMTVILTHEALKLHLRCPVILDADSEVTDSC